MPRLPSTLSALLVLSGSLLSAQTCELVCDIDPRATPLASDPFFMARCGGTIFFGARTTPANGVELWKTDGTVAGTTMVKDIEGGRDSHGVSFEWACCDNKLFFRAISAAEGAELWVSDGTTAGTRIVRDINPGVGSSFPLSFECMGGKLYFRADDGTRGQELWVTDGTTAGTKLVKDIWRFGGSGGPNGLQVNPAGDTIYFAATDGRAGIELWKTDGTELGTVQVRDIRSGSAGSSPLYITTLGTKILFTASDGVVGRELWETDGTAAGTRLVKDVRPGSISGNYRLDPRLTARANGKIYFAADGPTAGRELWETDGTTVGTKRSADIAPGPDSSSPISLFAVGSTVYLSARDTLNNYELYKFEAGTATRVAEIQPGTEGSSPSGFFMAGTRLLFSADDGTTGRELWTTDGTTAGTARVLDIHLGSSSAEPIPFASLSSGTALFRADDGSSGAELWITNGTTAGTQLFKDLLPGVSGMSSLPSVVNSAWGSTVYLSADDGIHGREPWIRDASGCRLLRDVWPGERFGRPNPSAPGEFTPAWVNGRARVFFSAQDAVGRELWVTDGTSAGTTLLVDIQPGPASSSPGSFTPLGNRVLFAANDGVHGYELWATDGTATGTALVKDVTPGPTGSLMRYFIRSQGVVYFTSGTSLWKSDGTTAGTIEVKAVTVEGTGVQRTVRFQGGIAFAGTQAANSNRGIWMSDGTAAGTRLVKDLGTTSVDDLTPCGNQLFFVVNTGGFGRELWRTDGTAAGTQIVKDIVAGPQSSGPQYVTCVGDRVFFAATSASGRELWLSDGTDAGTVQVADIAAGTSSSNPSFLAAVGNRVVFQATDGTAATVWQSDGTPQGTKQVCAGSDVLDPRGFSQVGDALYFIGFRENVGLEPFRVTQLGAMIETLGEGPGSTLPNITSSPPALGMMATITGTAAPTGHTGILLFNSQTAAPRAVFASPLACDFVNLATAIPITLPSTSSWQVPIQVPNTATLRGQTVAIQAFYLPTSVFPLQSSNGLLWTVGD